VADSISQTLLVRFLPLHASGFKVPIADDDDGRSTTGACFGRLTMLVQRSILAMITLGALALGMLIVEVSPALATPITYTERVTGSGSLNGVAFNNATILLTETSDTSNVTNQGSNPHIFVNIGTVTLIIDGGIPVTFTDTVAARDYQPGPVADFIDLTSVTAILGTLNNTFATYDVTTAIGPITDTATFNIAGSFPTTGGAFILTSVDGSSTFTAAVPEPASLTLVATGLLGLGAIKWRRRMRWGKEVRH
jgi:hypothetical protein